MFAESPSRSAAALSSVDRIAGSIRTSIAIGAFSTGQALEMKHLTQQFNVSHIPIREALRLLEAEGLVEIVRSRHARVAGINADEITSIFELRAAVEPEIAGRSAELFTPADVAMLESHLPGRDPDIGAELRTHIEFHLGLLRPAAADWDLRWHLRHAYLPYSHLLVSPRDTAAQHRRRREHQHLLAAARSRSASRLSAALQTHLHRDFQRMLAGMGSPSRKCRPSPPAA
jgi:DNA-binding GntR family transcriptional regulator